MERPYRYHCRASISEISFCRGTGVVEERRTGFNLPEEAVGRVARVALIGILLEIAFGDLEAVLGNDLIEGVFAAGLDFTGAAVAINEVGRSVMVFTKSAAVESSNGAQTSKDFAVLLGY